MIQEAYPIVQSCKKSGPAVI